MCYIVMVWACSMGIWVKKAMFLLKKKQLFKSCMPLKWHRTLGVPLSGMPEIPCVFLTLNEYDDDDMSLCNFLILSFACI